MSNTEQLRKEGYRVLDVLGRGGMGQVYRAVRDKDGQHVALKVLMSTSDTHLQALRREVRALRRLDHPHIVQIVDDGLDSSAPWYAMELSYGRPWSTLLPHPKTAPVATESTTLWTETWATRHPDPLSSNAPSTRSTPTAQQSASKALKSFDAERMVEQLRYAAQVVHALGYMHGQGLIHGDLKPGNILIESESKRALVVDFGLAADTGLQVTSEAIERSAIAAGTVRYMSPEQAMGGALGPASDLYALGCILYHIITGHPPFTDDSPQAVLHCHVKRPPLPPSRHVAGVPAPLDALVLQLLAKDPRQRPSQPMALLAALNRVGAPGLSQLSQVPGAPLPTLAPLVHSPAMAGRDALVDTLLSQLTALDEADGDGAKASKQGLKRRWLVVGASGVGKSRVALEVARQARQANANVLACQPGVSDDSAPQRPLSMFRRLLLAHRRQVPKPAW
ncbi:MAG: protein kinase, partial [Myxococcota bacterium]